jgi:hypothetical protein
LQTCPQAQVAAPQLQDSCLQKLEGIPASANAEEQASTGRSRKSGQKLEVMSLGHPGPGPWDIPRLAAGVDFQFLLAPLLGDGAAIDEEDVVEQVARVREVRLRHEHREPLPLEL